MQCFSSTFLSIPYHQPSKALYAEQQLLAAHQRKVHLVELTFVVLPRGRRQQLTT